MIFKKMKTKSMKTICVVDNIGGSYVNVAMELNNFFEKVYYHSVNQNPFPMKSMSSIGIGYDDIERIDDFWSNIDLFDIIIFPDIYFKDWGYRLRVLGKQVWGGCPSEELETDRKLFKEELQSVGLSIAPTEYIIGIDDLIDKLKTRTDVWLKISYFRGQMETYHHINMNQSSIWLENLKVSLGPLGKSQEFIIETPIESIAEVGFDGYTINGILPNECIWGIETKDCAYIAKHCPIIELPQPILEVNSKFEPVLQKYKHNGFYSNEIRVGKNGINYYTDPAMRAGSPPSNSYLGWITNWDEIITNGVEGIMTEPVFSNLYCIELILKSTYCYTNYMPINITSEFRQNLKLKGCLNVDGQDYIVPFEQGGIKELKEFGSVVVFGDDVVEIMTKAVEIAGQIDCYGLTYDADAINRTMESINNIEKNLNLKF